MKNFTYRFALLIACIIFTNAANAQTDTTYFPADTSDMVVVLKDERVDLFSKKMAAYYAAYNKSTKKTGTKTGYENGYRLMVANTSDRNYAMQVRSYLLQRYPGHMVHMTFVNPYIKLKFGDFTDKAQAMKIRKELTGVSLIKGNIYVVPEQVIVKRSLEEEETDSP